MVGVTVIVGVIVGVREVEGVIEIVGVMVIVGVGDTEGVLVGVNEIVGVIDGVIEIVGVIDGVIEIVGVIDGVNGGATTLSLLLLAIDPCLIIRFKERESLRNLIFSLCKSLLLGGLGIWVFKLK
jgi:hypothetical protein